MIFVRARAVKNPNPSQAAASHARAVQDGPSRPLSGSLIYHEMLPVMPADELAHPRAAFS
jgi:hypothetical protein